MSAATNNPPQTHARRTRNDKLNIARISSLSNVLVSTAIQLAVMRLLAQSLGTDGFAAATASLTVLGLIPFLDLGLILFLQTNAPNLIAKRDFESLQVLLSSSAAYLGLAAALLIGAVGLTSIYFGDFIVMPAAGKYQQSVAGSLFTVLTFAAIGLPFLIYAALLNAHQLAFVNDLFAIAVKILAFPITYYLIANQFDLAYICGALSLPSVMSAILSFFFSRSMFTYSKMRLSVVNVRTVFGIARSSWLLNIVQILSFIVASADPLVIAFFCEAEAQVAFTTSLRVATLFAIPFSVYCQPLTAAYNQAYAVGDESWVMSVYARTLIKVSVLSITLFTALTVGLNAICRLIIPDLQLSLSESIVYSIWVPYIAINAVVSGIALSAKFTTLLYRFYIPFCILAIFAKMIVFSLGYSPVITTGLFFALSLLAFLVPVHLHVEGSRHISRA